MLRLLALLVFLPAAAAQPVPLDSLARAFAAEAGLPSVVVGVTVGGERTVVGVGDVHGAAPDADTPYEIGSISKVLTSLALADAVARGEAALTTPVEDLLPDSVAVPSHAAGPVRLVDLATHTSGLPRIAIAMGIAPGFDAANPYAAFGPEPFAAALAALTPATPPGEAYAYSNLGAGLLGYALAQRAGTSYGALLADRVLGPLGMTATTLATDTTVLARGHGADGAPAAHWTWTEPTVGAGGWRSTAADLLTLAEAAIDPAATPLADALALGLEPRAAIDGTRSVGLGWHVFPLPDGQTVAAHDGGTGGFSTLLAVVPEASVGVVVLVNRSSEPGPFTIDLVRRLLAAPR